MQRNIIQLSPTTCVVSLPAKWLRANNLEKGNKLIVSEQDNGLFISTSHKQTVKTCTIDCTKIGNEKLLYAHIDGAYASGFDEIVFLFHSKKDEKVIISTTDEVPGMILSEQSDSRIVFKDITGEFKEDVSQIVNRIFNMIITLLNDSVEAISRKDFDFTAKIKNRDRAIGSYISYCHRQVNRFGYSPVTKTGTISTYLKLLEILADYFCDYIKIANSRSATEQKKELGQYIEIVKGMQKLFSRFTPERILELERKRVNIKDTVIGSHLFDLFELHVQLRL